MSTTQINEKDLSEFAADEFRDSIFITSLTGTPKFFKQNRKYKHLPFWHTTHIYRGSLNRSIATFWNDNSDDFNNYFLDSLTEEWMLLTNNKVYTLNKKIATKISKDELKTKIHRRILNKKRYLKDNPVPEDQCHNFIQTTHRNGMLNETWNIIFTKLHLV